ncbi:EAL domain-containing protein [uncultured Tateyamaria sp.]|uniref:sensor domain-containing phosphodiesterase n=1 Tax=uncultured Tateyamaria sp. TaxID=455651 RepID=UPI00261EC4DA|nr:EAL domain-containing protein [uncultured Tateyamaria sp.]
MEDAHLLAAAQKVALVADETIDASLRFVREHLGMEIAYLSEFVEDDLVFRAVDAPGFEAVVSAGDKMPLEAAYCRHILEGRLPELIQDTSAEPLCQTIDVTHAIPIKSHVSIPILRADGTPYGMFCCLSRQSRADLNLRDLDVMRAFAAISGEQVNNRLTQHHTSMTLRNQTLSMIEDKDFDIVYQPIMDARTRKPKGFESLCRFRSDPYRPPNVWIDEARQAGLQQELEVCLIEAALKALDHLPDNVYVSVNSSPDTVASGALADVLMPWPAERIVLEVTEHSMVADYDKLLKELDVLRFRGVRLAIDDAGAGYAGLQHIVRLHPDIIKLDISLTAQIDTSVVRRSLGAALVSFAREIGADIVAEGIETGEELDTLTGLGVPLAQGYFLGRPSDLETAVNWFAEEDGQASA